MQLEVTAEMVALIERGEPFVVATLVDAHGSTPQKVGARILVRRDGSLIGTLGGGCIEAEVWEVAKAAMESGEPRVLDFTLNEDIAVDYGLACGGTERILVDPTVARLDAALAGKMLSGARGAVRGVVLQTLSGPPIAAKLAVWEDGSSDGDFGDLRTEALQLAQRLIEAPRPKPVVVTLSNGVDVFADVFAEPPEMVVIGGGHVGRAVGSVAKLLGYRLAVIDDRADFANSERFPDADAVIAADIEAAIRDYPMTRNSAVIIVTRGHKYDYQALSAAARSNAGYIGLMGSRRKVTLIYRQLMNDGVPEERLHDIHAPIGLDIGAVSPEEIAVAIMAEVTMERLGGTGKPLCADRAMIERARPKTVA
jgi:xanthine dehydrogenase accessory factor